jgi:hypothetical protein
MRSVKRAADLEKFEGGPMIKTKHSKMGKRLIAAMKEVVDHAEGRTALPMRYVEVPSTRMWLDSRSQDQGRTLRPSQEP